ncbi:MAG: four helix bundle protein [Patescibacteria group bacterium]
MSLKSFRDLDVYQTLYRASLLVMTRIVAALPQIERFDLADQLRRASKAAPRLLAEGYAKKHQRLGFQKYLDDAMAECNECIVCLNHVRDIYRINPELCDELAGMYDTAARQLFRLADAWDNFKTRNPATTPRDHTRRHTLNK